MKSSFACMLFASVLIIGCGGDDGGDTSGVDQAKPITDLSTSEVTTFCQWSIDVQGGAGHETDCGDGVTVTVNTQAECEAEYAQIPTGCSTVTVAEMEACVDALAAEPCNFEASACAEYFACLFGG
jgi:hypothetical protein